MIKKFFKWSFFIFIGFILLGALAYGGFHLWEYSTGGKYIDFLSENSETIPIEKTFNYDVLNEDINNSQLILVGEIHGTEEPTKFDADFFKFLHKNHQVKNYIAEVDFVQANLLNDFLVSGNEELLQKALKKWAVFQGRNNKDYFDKFKDLQQYHQQLPEDKKFKFIGIDQIQDLTLWKNYFKTFSSDSLVDFEKPLLQIVEQLEKNYLENPDTSFILSQCKTNLNYALDKQNREETMFQNFLTLFKQYNLETEKLYGFFGLYHVFQYRINGSHPLASKLRESDLNLEGKILSINFMMNDSHMVMPSSDLPSFMSDDGPYTKMPLSADNMLFIYIVGIKDFKRMTPEYHKSLIKFNIEDNPYSNSSRLSKTIQLLPVTETFEMTDKGMPYIQYTIFVRNSDWAEPME